MTGVSDRPRHQLERPLPAPRTLGQWNLEMKVMAVMSRRCAQTAADIVWTLNYHGIAKTHETAVRLTMESLRGRGLVRVPLLSRSRGRAYRLTRRGRLCQDVVQLTPALSGYQAQSVALALGC